MAASYVNIVYRILYDITIYGAHTCVSGLYKYSLRFSESGRILKQSIRQIKFTWSVNYVCEIFHSSISDTISTWVRHINRTTALCCHVGLTYGAAILRLENEARHANYEIALFQSVTNYIQHRLKAMCHTGASQWSAREIASMAPPAARERHAKNVWHIALRMFDCGIRVKNAIKINFITVVTNYLHY